MIARAQKPWIALLLIGALLTGAPRPARADSPALDWPSIFQRLQNLDPNQLNQLGQSALALIAAVTTLWNFKGHTKSIKEGATDVWNFRTNRAKWREAENALAKFKIDVMREEAKSSDGLFNDAPSLLLRFGAHIRNWTDSVNDIDAQAKVALGIKPQDQAPSFDDVRKKLNYHLRFGIVREVAGMMYNPDYPKILEAVSQWEKDGDSKQLDLFIEDALTRPGHSTLANEKSGQRWLTKYVELSRQLAAADWLHKRSTLRLKDWWSKNEPLGLITPEQREWWSQFQALEKKEAATSKTFTDEYTNLIHQLNREAESQGKTYPVVVHRPDRRDAGLLHTEDSTGTALLASQMTPKFREHCTDALNAFTTARDTAKGKGTLPGMGMRVTTKIVTPTLLLVTGVTTAIIAYNGFHNLLKKILYGQ